MELTRTEKIQTRHIWTRAMSVERINLTKQFCKDHPGIITPSREWSDMLCLRVETLKSII